MHGDDDTTIHAAVAAGELPLEVYADWLEEHGHAIAATVRKWDGTLDEPFIGRWLSEENVIRWACDCAEHVVAASEQRAFAPLRDAMRNFADGEGSERDVREVVGDGWSEWGRKGVPASRAAWAAATRCASAIAAQRAVVPAAASAAQAARAAAEMNAGPDWRAVWRSELLWQFVRLVRYAIRDLP